ncbi:hypothetical protein HRbin02_00008 [Candidatus Calditenuaceae archaeon HR02]|nr:hypothetical protein HRbin02_00008 [Candidatus Calditenuaceae archaeon HR02]
MNTIVEEVDNAQDFDSILRLVKRVVEEKLGMRRAGLMLIIADAPPGILAYHEVGSNAIVVNRRHLEGWVIGKSKTEKNSYIFVVLLHEYLHSLGILDEVEVRRLVRTLVQEYFGPDHIATRLAGGEAAIGGEFIAGVYLGRPREPVLVKDFDTENLSYIG